MNIPPFRKYCFPKRDGLSRPYTITVLGRVTEIGIKYPTSQFVYELTVGKVMELRKLIHETTTKGELINRKLQYKGLDHHTILGPIKEEFVNNIDAIQRKIDTLLVRVGDDDNWVLTNDVNVVEHISLAAATDKIKEIDLVIDDAFFVADAKTVTKHIDLESIIINKTLINEVEKELFDLTGDILDAGFSPASLSGLKQHFDGIKLIASNAIEEALGKRVDKSLSEALEKTCYHDYGRLVEKLFPQRV